MRIGVNLLYAHTGIGGAWNYISYLLDAIADTEMSHEFVCFVTERSKSLVPDSPFFNSTIVEANTQYRPARVLYENTRLQQSAHSHHLDCMHWFANTVAVCNNVPAAVTIHDLQAFSGHHRFPPAKQLYLSIMMKHTVRSAKTLLAVSEATKDSLVRTLHADSAKTYVLPVVIGSLFQPVSEQIVQQFRSRYGLPTEFWLYVANTYPHKNHASLIEAYADLLRQCPTSWPLALRGESAPHERVRLDRLAISLGVQNKIIWLPRLPKSQLPMLYSSATALVFPSRYEGGGIPILEAMACGLPVLASRIPAICENAADAAAYFDPQNTTDIEQAMRRFQVNAGLREHLRSLGHRQTASHSPKTIVPRLLSIYESITEA